MFKKSLIPMIVIFLVTACAPVNPQAPGPDPTPTIPPTETAPSETEEPMPGSTIQSNDLPMLVYHRSGGIAGIIENWQIYPDGRLATDDRVLEIAPDEVSTLVREIENLGFYKLEDNYIPKNTCCDRFFYEITINTEGQSKTVKMLDGTPDLPESLLAIVERVSSFVASQPGLEQ